MAASRSGSENLTSRHRSGPHKGPLSFPVIALRPVAPTRVAGLLWDVLRADLPAGTTQAAFLLFLCSGIRFLGIYSGAELVGAIGYKGEAVHMAVAPAWRGKWFSDRIGRQIVAEGLARSPRLVAVIRSDDAATKRIAARCGFAYQGGDGPWERWLLSAPPQTP